MGRTSCRCHRSKGTGAGSREHSRTQISGASGNVESLLSSHKYQTCIFTASLLSSAKNHFRGLLPFLQSRKSEQLVFCVLWVLLSKVPLSFVFYFLPVQTHSRLKLQASLSAELQPMKTLPPRCRFKPNYTKLNCLPLPCDLPLLFLVIRRTTIFPVIPVAVVQLKVIPPSPPSQNQSVCPLYTHSMLFLCQTAYSSLPSPVAWLITYVPTIRGHIPRGQGCGWVSSLLLHG